MCPDMRESLRLDLVDADEAEEGRDRLLAAARTRAIRPVAGATFSVGGGGGLCLLPPPQGIKLS